jgi:hypothetical protein
MTFVINIIICFFFVLYIYKFLAFISNLFMIGENLLKCNTQNEKGLILTIILFTLYFDPHRN